MAQQGVSTSASTCANVTEEVDAMVQDTVLIEYAGKPLSLISEATPVSRVGLGLVQKRIVLDRPAILHESIRQPWGTSVEEREAKADAAVAAEEAELDAAAAAAQAAEAEAAAAGSSGEAAEAAVAGAVSKRKTKKKKKNKTLKTENLLAECLGQPNCVLRPGHRYEVTSATSVTITNAATKLAPGDGLGLGWVPKEGLLAGVLPGIAKPKLIMGVDVDYPPYAYLNKEPYDAKDDLDEVVGVGVDMIKGMAKHCNFDVHVMRAHWADCWGAGEIGKGLLQGWYHGCMTYTHAAGVRNQYLEFSNSWAIPNKPSGLIVKLNDGKPTFDGNDNLNGKIIVDVTGWAPTAETIYFVKNQCTGEPFSGFRIIQGDDVNLSRASEAKGPNDRALLAVLEGKADAMFIYGDQAANYRCKPGETRKKWNCDLWNGLGTEFAYAQSGMFGWMHNGTTISMSKKGSGVADFLDACFEKFRQTKDFYKVCKTMHGDPPHSQLHHCIPNKYFYEDPDFKASGIAEEPYMFATKKHKSACSDGYCPCP